MSEQLIVRQEEFDRFCELIRESGIVAFDTEFVSEHTYHPELGLLQFAVPDRAVAVDPLEVHDLRNWWEIMADGDTSVVVHAGRAEVLFCLTLAGKAPRNVIDVQIAEGLRSPSFPLSYSALVKRVLGESAHGRETRTDWLRRPLSEQQISYALDDVRYLLPLWERQRQSLSAMNRLSWAETEFEKMVDDARQELDRKSWQRLPGIHKLNPREFSVAVELSEWREAEAARRNRPRRQVFRDDLIIELAHRQPKSYKQLMSTRDMNRRNYKQIAPELLKCIEKGLSTPSSELPQRVDHQKRSDKQEEHILGRLLGIALSNRCADMKVARSLVGTSEDLRDLVRWHLLEHDEGIPPDLATGWRAEVCGNLLTDLLDGRVSLRVSDPRSEAPLVFEPTDAD